MNPASLPPFESREIELPADLYKRLVAHGISTGVPAEALLEQIFADLPEVKISRQPTRPGASTKVLEVFGIHCSCCPAACGHPLRWRGTLRCGCPKTKS